MYKQGKTIHATAARMKCTALMGRALAEGWTAARLAKEANVTLQPAAKYLSQWRREYRKKMESSAISKTTNLGQVARRARDAELRALEKLAPLLDRLTKQLESSEDLDAGELDKLISARRKTWQHAEALTGMDVAKQIAVRREAMKDGQPISWDGCTEIEARPIELIPPESPAPDEDILAGL